MVSSLFGRFSLLIAACLFTIGATPLSAVEGGVGPYRAQTIELEAGWNAVYLEIEPLETDPSTLFAGTPIEIVAAYFRPVTAMEFIDSPSEVLPDRKGWNVWYAPERDDTLLSNLYLIQAHHAYLIYVEEAYSWTFEGVPFSDSILWHPNSYSLVGFPIHVAEQPTLANFFSGVDAHSPLKVYRMIGGRWALVTNPEEVMMEPGVAYWAYSQGASNFAGPLRVTFSNQAAGGLFFTEHTDSHKVVFTNESSYPQELTVSLLPGDAGELPMAYLVEALDGPDGPLETLSIPFNGPLSIGPLEPGQSFSVSFQVVQTEVSKPLMGANLSITTDAGLLHEIPVVSIRRDLINL